MSEDRETGVRRDPFRKVTKVPFPESRYRHWIIYLRADTFFVDGYSQKEVIKFFGKPLVEFMDTNDAAQYRLADDWHAVAVLDMLRFTNFSLVLAYRLGDEAEQSEKWQSVATSDGTLRAWLIRPKPRDIEHPKKVVAGWKSFLEATPTKKEKWPRAFKLTGSMDVCHYKNGRLKKIRKLNLRSEKSLPVDKELFAAREKVYTKLMKVAQAEAGRHRTQRTAPPDWALRDVKHFKMELEAIAQVKKFPGTKPATIEGHAVGRWAWKWSTIIPDGGHWKASSEKPK